LTTGKTKRAATAEKLPAETSLDSLHQKQESLKKVRTKINRYLSTQSHFHAAIKAESVAYRRARTRTLIQCGGLLKISGLLEICQIQEGDDLQLDLESYDKAATLLGILLDAAVAIPNPPDSGEMETWRESGTRLLKQRAAQMTYQKGKKCLKNNRE